VRNSSVFSLPDAVQYGDKVQNKGDFLYTWHAVKLVIERPADRIRMKESLE